jgi:hypothetical protein
MATELSESTTADHDIAFERFRAALADDPARYPRGAHFVPAEEPWAAGVVLRHIRSSEPVVLVYADGEERIIEIERPSDAAHGALLWLAFRGLVDRIGSARDRLRDRTPH